MFSDLATRTTGAFPISIGTSIAMEFYTGTISEVNKEGDAINPGKYKQFWINLKTLVRNIIGSLPTEKKKNLIPEDVSEALYQEMDIISNIVRQHDQSCEVIYYVSNYHISVTKYKYFSLRVNKTPLQQFHFDLTEKTIKLILKKPDNPNFKIAVFESKLTGFGKKTLRYPPSIIITHCAYDLLSSREFDELLLLESHTGAVKRKDKWHTKYVNGNDLPFIPFSERLLPVFGDSELFYPAKSEVREAVIGIAKKHHWTSITTDEKILFSIKSLNNQFLIDNLVHLS